MGIKGIEQALSANWRIGLSVVCLALSGCNVDIHDRDDGRGDPLLPATPSVLTNSLCFSFAGGDCETPLNGQPPAQAAATFSVAPKISPVAPTEDPFPDTAAQYEVMAGGEVNLEVSQTSGSVFQSLFVKVLGSNRYFAFDVPEGIAKGTSTDPGDESGIRFTINVSLPADLGTGSFRVLVSGRDADGLVSNVVSFIIIVVDGSTPRGSVSANAGTDFTVVEGSNVILDGTGSTGAIASFAWSQDSGRPVTLDVSSSPTPRFIAPASAVDTFALFTLTVTNEAGDSSTDQVLVSFEPRLPNSAPVANAGEDIEAAEETIVILDGSASFDPDGEIQSYRWLQVGGRSVTLANADQDQAAFFAPATTTPQRYTFELTVADDDNISDRDRVSVLILPESLATNVPPVADAGDDFSVDEGATGTLNGAGSSDPDGSLSSVAWAQIAGPTVAITNANSRIASFVAPPGSGGQALSFRITVTDDIGVSRSDTVAVSINDVTTPLDGNWHRLGVELSLSSGTGALPPQFQMASARFRDSVEIETISATDVTLGNDGTGILAGLWELSQDDPASDYVLFGEVDSEFDDGEQQVDANLVGDIVVGNAIETGISIDGSEALRTEADPQALVSLGSNIATTGAFARELEYGTQTLGTSTIENADDLRFRIGFLSTELLVRQSTDFTPQRIAGSYNVITLADGADDISGDRFVASCTARWTITTAGAVTESNSRCTGVSRVGGVPEAFEVEEDPRNFGFTVTSNGGLISDAGLRGFASPNGRLLVLTEATSDAGSADGSHVFALRVPNNPTANLPVRSYAISGIGSQYATADETRIDLYNHAQLSFGSSTASLTTVLGSTTRGAYTIPDGGELFLLSDFEDPVRQTRAFNRVVDEFGRIDLNADDTQITIFRDSEFGLLIGLVQTDALDGETLIRSERAMFIGGPRPEAQLTIENRAPVLSITASSQSTVPNGGTVDLTAVVNDDGSEAEVRWRARAGSFSSLTGTSTTWTAPATGSGTLLIDAIADDGLRSTLQSVAVSFGD